ncbi:hypothetical protein V2G26_003487 [Clonostachys chloroleuca]
MHLHHFHHHLGVPEIMATPPTPTTKSRRDRDTGFPEPFCGSYNTTLPHPDADLSPNAVISGDHLSLEGSMRRRRLSMLHKHRRTVSQSSGNSNSSINTPSQALQSVLGAIQSQLPGTSPAARPGSSAQDSIDEEPHHCEMEDDMRPESRDTIPSSPHSSKRGLFHGWRKGRH